MIDVNEVKQYNEELKKYKEKASTLKAQIELYENELTNKCAELSRELGIEVTKDNLEAVYAEYESKLQQTLETGRAVLQKIAQSNVVQPVTTNNIPGMQVGNNQSVNQQPMYQNNMANMNQQMMYQNNMMNMQGQQASQQSNNGLIGQQPGIFRI